MTASQYNRINELLSDFSSLNAAVEAAEAEIKTVQLAAAKELLPKHAAAKVALSSIESTLRALSDEHYQELFPTEKRTHKTPFGALEYRKSSSLEIEDEEKSILKIEARFEADMTRFIRTRKELNIEALEELDDDYLALVGIVRKHKDNFKVVPFALMADKPAKKAAKVKEAA